MVWNTVDYCWYNRQQNLALYLKVYKGKKRMSALTGAIVLNEIYAFRQVLSLIAKKKKKKNGGLGCSPTFFFFLVLYAVTWEDFQACKKKLWNDITNFNFIRNGRSWAQHMPTAIRQSFQDGKELSCSTVKHFCQQTFSSSARPWQLSRKKYCKLCNS